jgi:hypothetical protein
LEEGSDKVRQPCPCKAAESRPDYLAAKKGKEKGLKRTTREEEKE